MKTTSVQDRHLIGRPGALEIERAALAEQSERLAALFRSWREVSPEEKEEQDETRRILEESLVNEPFAIRPSSR